MSIGRDYLYSVVKYGGIEDFRITPKTMYSGEAELELYTIIESMTNDKGLPSIEIVQKVTGFDGEVFKDLELLYKGLQVRKFSNTYADSIPKINALVNKGDTSTVATELQSLSETLLRQTEKPKAKDLGQLFKELDGRLVQRRLLHGVVGVPTPWPTLTKAIHGWRKANTYILAARPKIGKTQALVLSALEALSLGYKVLFVSMEMSEEEIMDRATSILLKIPATSLSMGRVSSFLNMRLQQLAEEGFTKNLKLVDGAFATTISDIEGLIAEELPDIVFIDGAYLINIPEMSREKQWERVAEIFKRIKMLAMRRLLPIVCSYQFNREAGKKGGDVENIQLSDALGQITSALIGLNQVAGNPMQRKMSLKANRHGPLAELLIAWNWSKNIFTELDSDSEIKESGFEYTERHNDEDAPD